MALTSLNQTIDQLVRDAQENYSAHTNIPGAVTIHRNAKGDIRVTYSMTHWIPAHPEEEGSRLARPHKSGSY